MIDALWGDIMGIDRLGQHDGLPCSIESFKAIEARLSRVSKAVEDVRRWLGPREKVPYSSELLDLVEIEVMGCLKELHKFRDELGEQEEDEYLDAKWNERE